MVQQAWFELVTSWPPNTLSTTLREPPFNITKYSKFKCKINLASTLIAGDVISGEK